MTAQRPRVIIESPFAGHVALNQLYLQAALRDSLLRDEAPFASHGLYTQAGVLDDAVPAERAFGIEAGFAWRRVADITAVYIDLGVSKGMEWGIKDAEALQNQEPNPCMLIDRPHHIVHRSLPDWKEIGEVLNEITVWCKANEATLEFSAPGYGLFLAVHFGYPHEDTGRWLGHFDEPIHVGMRALLDELKAGTRHDEDPYLKECTHEDFYGSLIMDGACMFCGAPA